jgi:hypothetical protein
MSWVVIRKITNADTELLNARAIAFQKRRMPHLRPFEDWRYLHDDLYYGKDDPYIYPEWRAWLKVFRRAVKSNGAEGVAYGYIGYSSKY